MVKQSNYMQEVFPAPTLVAFKRQKNVKESLVRAKVAPKTTRPKQILRGMKKCGKCLASSYIVSRASTSHGKYVNQ